MSFKNKFIIFINVNYTGYYVVQKGTTSQSDKSTESVLDAEGDTDQISTVTIALNSEQKRLSINVGRKCTCSGSDFIICGVN